MNLFCLFSNTTPKAFYQQYYDTHSRLHDVVVLYNTVVVLLDKGNPVGINWQDGCGACLTERCVNNTCGTEKMDGNTDICLEKADCNIKVRSN